MTALLPSLGTAALLAAGAAYIYSWLLYRKVDPGNPEPLLGCARRGLDLATLSLAVTSAVLMALLFARVYRVEYVYAHVSNDLPFLYVVSAFWAGQEGSFLLWALLAAVLGSFLSRTAGEWEVPVLRIYLPSAFVLVGLTLISGLFRLIPQSPPEGAGLNPLLRDPWMAIHPPVTFLGYAALSIPFAYAIAGLERKQKDEWVRAALPWTLIGWLTLGAGIIMGGFWAYKVLGWGGWWGWDPVENASLLPWLIGLALVHGLLLQRSRNKFARTNVVLAIITFALVIYSTFLTRSGALEGASVHTFGASSVGTWLALWIVAVLGYGLYRYAGAAGRLTGGKLDEPLLSREVLMVVGLLTIVAITLLIGLGTSAPIISRLSGGDGAAVDISYYGRTTLPLGILLALVTGIGVLLRWKGGREVAVAALVAAGAAGVIGIAAAACMGTAGILNLIFAGSAVFALVANLILFERALSGGGLKRAGGYLSHIGVALMLIAVVAATTGRKEQADLVYRSPTPVLDYELTFTGWITLPEGKQATTVQLSRPGSGGALVLRPRLYRQYGSGQMMVRAEPHISRGLTRDLYLAPVQYLPPGEAMDAAGETFTLTRGESRTFDEITFTFEDYDRGGHGAGEMTAGSIGARVILETPYGSETLIPRMTMGGGAPAPVQLPAEIGGQLSLRRIDADNGRVELLYATRDAPADGRSEGGILTVELSEKPLMSILWTGVVLVLLGGLIAAVRRWQPSAGGSAGTDPD